MATTEVEFRCFVGGLAWATDSHTLEEAFRPFGEILESKIINDRETGSPAAAAAEAAAEGVSAAAAAAEEATVGPAAAAAGEATAAAAAAAAEGRVRARSRWLWRRLRGGNRYGRSVGASEGDRW
uniref:RRM domain-containing protein n=1 Tax=Ananas comosus var. bracteatus TaxID=296719 RepID=A0A6V7PBI3_ANACO|nr:unnamed protein product [Ananas comosus var. bracteatus]